jgi:hypothetical protein
MLDSVMATWEFIWAYLVPVLLVLSGAGVAIYTIFMLPWEMDSLWRKLESIGFGLTTAAMTKWFIQFYFEFRSMGHEFSEDTFPMVDTILAMVITGVCYGAAQLIRSAGMPWIVIGSVLALVAVFGA